MWPPFLRIPLIYLVFGSAWILATDYLADENRWSHQTLKGLAFVAFSAAVIAALIRRADQAALRDREKRAEAEAARIRSEGFLRAIIECSPLALLSIDSEGVVRAWNESAQRVFGWSADEVIGQPLPFIAPEHVESSYELLRRILAGETLIGIELTRKRKDGSRISISVYGAPMLDDAGQIVGAVGVVEDLSEKRQKDAELALSEARYESLFENNNAPMLLLDPETGDLIGANPAAVRFYGWTREQLLGMSIRDINTLGPHEVTLRLAEARSGTRQYFQFRHRLADGSIRDVDVFAGGIRVGGRNLLYSIIHDITDKKVAEAALLASEDRWRRVISASPFPIMLHEEGGRVILVNEAWQDISGYSQADLPTVEDWVRRAYPGQETDLTQYILSLYELTESRAEGEYRVTCRDGSVRLWDFMSTPTGVHPNGKRGVVSMAVDITDRRAAEERLGRAQHLESVGRLAGGVAHDFNNLLTLILGHTDLALASNPELAVQKELDGIRLGAERSAVLTRQLLAFARRQTARPESISLSKRVAALVPTLRSLLGEDRTLQWNEGPEADYVLVDSSQFDQVLVNLCTNARDATAPTGRIELSIERLTMGEDEHSAGAEDVTPGEYVALHVEDNGVGMSPEVQDRILEPFFTTKPPGKGTGLGVPSVFGIVRQNGGFLRIESAPGQGSRFSVYFPVAAAPDVVPEVPSSEQADPNPCPSPAGGRILLVEDEEPIRRLASEWLSSTGYQVQVAADAESAISLLQATGLHPDLLITDVVLPGLTGRELAERALAIYPKMRVLFVSGYAADVMEDNGIPNPAIDFLEKPFTLKELSQRVQSALTHR